MQQELICETRLLLQLANLCKYWDSFEQTDNQQYILWSNQTQNELFEQMININRCTKSTLGDEMYGTILFSQNFEEAVWILYCEFIYNLSNI